MDSVGTSGHFGIFSFWGFFNRRPNNATRGALIVIITLHSMQNKATLVIGTNILEGSVITLAKPFAVIEKHTSAPAHSHQTPSREESETQTQTQLESVECSVGNDTPFIRPGSKSNTSWAVHAIIKRKVIFKTRPRPLV